VGKVHEDEKGSLVVRAGRRSAFIDYGKIFKRLAERYTTREFTFSYKSLGYLRMRYYPLIERALEKVAPGGFSKIDYYKDSAIVFFLADLKEAKEVTYEDIKNSVELEMGDRIREKTVREMREAFLREAGLRSIF
jgi:hypothetical protein